MRVDQSRHQRAAAAFDHAGRGRGLRALADGGDAVAADQHVGGRAEDAARGVEHPHFAKQQFIGGRLSKARRRKREQQGRCGAAHLGELIARISVGMLASVDADGKLRSRPLAMLKMDDEPALWFLTSISSPNIGELDSSGMVGVSYSDGWDDFVSVSGATQVIRERGVIQELWSPGAKAWFPAGADDPDLAALNVQIHRTESWDGHEGVRRLPGGGSSMRGRLPSGRGAGPPPLVIPGLRRIPLHVFHHAQ